MSIGIVGLIIIIAIIIIGIVVAIIFYKYAKIHRMAMLDNTQEGYQDEKEVVKGEFDYVDSISVAPEYAESEVVKNEKIFKDENVADDIKKSVANIGDVLISKLDKMEVEISNIKEDIASKFEQAIVNKEEFEQIISEKGDNEKEIIEMLDTLVRMQKTSADVPLSDNSVDVIEEINKTEEIKEDEIPVGEENISENLEDSSPLKKEPMFSYCPDIPKETVVEEIVPVEINEEKATDVLISEKPQETVVENEDTVNREEVIEITTEGDKSVEIHERENLKEVEESTLKPAAEEEKVNDKGKYKEKPTEQDIQQFLKYLDSSS